MDELNKYGQTEDNKKICKPVYFEGQTLVRDEGNQGDIGTNYTPEKTQGRKECVGGILSAPQKSDQGKRKKHEPAKNGRDCVSIRGRQVA